MVLFNYATRELTAKVVYYGPGLCGKTTNLQYVHQNLPETVKGKMLSLATKTDRTLFFDFLPIDLGEIRGMKTRVQLYTVPGQVFYNETRKLVLKGADGIVFVADSQETMLGANVESYKNLEENLKAHGLNLADMPHVIQFNKRDLPKLASVEQMNAEINKYNAPFYEAVATTGIGVQDTLKAVTKLVLMHLTQKYDPQAAKAIAGEAPKPEAPAPVAAAPEPPPQPIEAGGVPLSDPPPMPGTPVESDREGSLPAFGDQEIDALVDEVEEVEAPATDPTPAQDDSVWMGAPQEEEQAGEIDEPAFDPSSITAEPPPVAESADAEPATEGGPEPSADEPAEELMPYLDEQAADSSFEVDRGFDPEWKEEPESFDVPDLPAAAAEPLSFEEDPIADALSVAASAPDSGATVAISADRFGVQTTAATESAIPVDHVDTDTPAPRVDDADVVLTQTATDADLFDDPDLQIARMEPGTAREVIVPVEIGEGETVRRFRLTIALRLDPVE